MPNKAINANRSIKFQNLGEKGHKTKKPRNLQKYKPYSKISKSKKKVPEMCQNVPISAKKVTKGGSQLIGATIRTHLLCVMFSSLFKYSESPKSENIKMHGVKSILDK